MTLKQCGKTRKNSHNIYKEKTKTTRHHRKNSHASMGKIQKQIQQALTETYPIQRKAKMAQEPEWTQQAKKWSTETEWEDPQQHLTSRNQLQEKITLKDKNTKNTTKDTPAKTIQAWKQAITYLQQHQKQIQLEKEPNKQTQKPSETDQKANKRIR